MNVPQFYLNSLISIWCNSIQSNRYSKCVLGNSFMSNAVLVAMMITKEGIYCSQGDCEYNPTVVIRATQHSAKIREQNKKIGMKVRSGF